eukprot:Gb_15390 [translate_table: standard]
MPWLDPRISKYFGTARLGLVCRQQILQAMSSLMVVSIILALYGQFVDSALELPGWLGETYRMPVRTKKDAFKSIVQVRPPTGFDPSHVTQLSWKPRLVTSCTMAKGSLEKSMVADNESGKSVMSEIRTSSGMFLNKYQDEIVTRIEDRIAAWTFLPKENGEALQILHYELGEKYEPHFDFFNDKANQALGGHRIATVLMYLSNVVKGGETIFPHAEGKDSQLKDDSWSDCAKRGYAVKPNKGDALLFFSLHPDVTTDEFSLHGSCPVIEGEKWSATKWIHVRSFDLIPKRAAGECVDEHKLCSHWASLGECTKNSPYMVGTTEIPGACRKSCQVC